MANLNTEEIKKLKKGELCGLIATVGAGAACAALVVLFSVAVALSNADLRIYALGICAPLLGVFTLVAAICNLKYGRAIDNIIKNYVREVFIENAALMHPERDSLTYFISNEGQNFFIKANNFKEVIVFDFSDFGKLSLSRKVTVSSAVTERLCATFCRLAERGGNYKTVSCCAVKDGKQGKTVSIIENGTPEKKAYKIYLKSK